VEGAVNYIIGLLLVVAGVIFALKWWSGRHKRTENGILPISAASMMIDERGHRTSVSRTFQAFAAAWPLYLAFVLIALGSAVLISGE